MQTTDSILDETDGIEYRLFVELVLLTSLLGYFISA